MFFGLLLIDATVALSAGLLLFIGYSLFRTKAPLPEEDTSMDETSDKTPAAPFTMSNKSLTHRVAQLEQALDLLQLEVQQLKNQNRRDRKSVV